MDPSDKESSPLLSSGEEALLQVDSDNDSAKVVGATAQDSFYGASDTVSLSLAEASDAVRVPINYFRLTRRRS